MLRISFLTKGGRGEGIPIFGLRARGLVGRVIGRDKKKKNWVPA
jgi:hypothetical protein